MAANQLVQTRIEGEIKEEAAAVLEGIGMTVSGAVRLFLTKIAREKALPFDPLVPNETTIRAMREAREGRGRGYTNMDDLRKDILNDPSP